MGVLIVVIVALLVGIGIPIFLVWNIGHMWRRDHNGEDPPGPSITHN